MIVYVYSKCSTCQKALQFLKDNHINCQIKEINLEPPSIQELKKMLHYKKGDLKKLFNTSGLLYKEMQLSQRLGQFSEKEALELLSKNGMLVKRPFILGEDLGFVGFKELEWNDLKN